MKKFNKTKCFSYVFTVILALGFVLTACEKPAVTLTTPESVNGFKLNTFVQIDSYTSVSKNTLTKLLICVTTTKTFFQGLRKIASYQRLILTRQQAYLRKCMN